MSLFNNHDLTTRFLQFCTIEVLKKVYIVNNKNKALLEVQAWFTCLKKIKCSTLTGISFLHGGHPTLTYCRKTKKYCKIPNYTKTFMKIYLNSYIHIFRSHPIYEVDNICNLINLISRCTFDSFKYLIKIGLVKENLLDTDASTVKWIFENAIISHDIELVQYLFNKKPNISDYYHYYYFAIENNFVDAVLFIKNCLDNDFYEKKNVYYHKKKIKQLYLISITEGYFDIVRYVYKNYKSWLDFEIERLIMYSCSSLQMFEIIYNYHFNNMTLYQNLLQFTVVKYGNLDIIKWIYDKGYDKGYDIYNYQTLEKATVFMKHEIIEYILFKNTDLRKHIPTLLTIAYNDYTRQTFYKSGKCCVPACDNYRHEKCRTDNGELCNCDHFKVVNYYIKNLNGSRINIDTIKNNASECPKTNNLMSKLLEKTKVLTLAVKKKTKNIPYKCLQF